MLVGDRECLGLDGGASGVDFAVAGGGTCNDGRVWTTVTDDGAAAGNETVDAEDGGVAGGPTAVVDGGGVPDETDGVGSLSRWRRRRVGSCRCFETSLIHGRHEGASPHFPLIKGPSDGCDKVVVTV